MFVELYDFRGLLKAKKKVNVAGFATRQCDRLDDVIGDAGAELVWFEGDMDRKRLFADDLLIGAGDGDKIAQVYSVGFGNRTALADDDHVQRHPYCIAGRFALAVNFAQEAVKRDIFRARLGSRREYRGVGQRP